jgi:ring-1,2-phenylacetyl-CoA epoxidase subunit PaaB
VNREGILHQQGQFAPAKELDQWQTWEVFHQANRGDQHSHVGIVHAPTAELALLFAKEQFARRFRCVNLWVVRTADVARTEYEDADMFEPAFDKSYREASAYRNREKIEDFLKGANKIVGGAINYLDLGAAFDNPDMAFKQAHTPHGGHHHEEAAVAPSTVNGKVVEEKSCTLIGVEGTNPTQPRIATVKVLTQ